MDSAAPIALLAGIPAAPQPRALFSPKEAEGILGISHATLYRLIAAGRLDARKLDGKTVVTATSIGQLIAALPRLGCPA
jgi:predicted DNA-binding transcriptional regulator AlpA